MALAARSRPAVQALVLASPALSSASWPTNPPALLGPHPTRAFSSTTASRQNWSESLRAATRGPFSGSGGLGAFGGARGRPLPVNTIVKFVPQQEAWIVERMGKFHRILEPGLAILIPVLDSIKYVKSLKEVAIEIPTQSAITQDNVTLELDGVLYYRIIDPFKASYGVEDHEYAISQLAQTTMRAEIGQLTLDRTLAERTQLNEAIVRAINMAALDWGIRCLRYEIRDVHPPENVVAAMHQQVSAERRKRAEILESEGARQAAINVAEGRRQAVILESEAIKAQQINQASGEAEAILLRANATSRSISVVSQAIAQSPYGRDAVSLSVAEKYVESFGKIAKESTTLVLPRDAGDVAKVVGEAMAVFGTLSRPGGAAAVKGGVVDGSPDSS